MTSPVGLWAGALALAAGALVLTALPGSAQDVEMFAEHYGTTPPAGYFEVIRQDPDAYRPLRGFRPMLRRDATGGGPARVIAPPTGPVTGTYRFPLLLGLYSDSPEPVSPYTAGELQSYYFDGPNPEGSTIQEYFDDASGGRVTLEGQTIGWTRSGLTRATVAGTGNGLFVSDGVYEFIVDLLDRLDDGGIDWGQFDNDGPDGVPNSGDDDGYVDLLGVMHPTQGAECTSASGDVWSHFWQLNNAGGQAGPYSTSTASASGGQILVDDYTIVPSVDCENEGVMEIGTLTHEIGHAFGVPDLYAVGGSHGGIGRWGLMGSGSWGCSDQDLPAKPCGMMAWTRSLLGWVTVTDLDRDLDHGVLTLDPVQTSNTAYRIDAGDGSGDWFLLENRQALDFDADVPAPGLLVWRIDQTFLDSAFPGGTRYTENRVNSTRTRMGVWLQQADGLDDLARPGGGRGDDGDPFPGSTGNTVFHASSDPASDSHLGSSAGVTLLDIEAQGQQASFRLLTRYQQITLRTEGTVGAGDFFAVDGAGQNGTDVVFSSAPYELHTLEAAGGETLEEGFRTGFIGWEDGSPRVRSWQTQLEDAVLTATYGNPEVRFDVTFESPAPGITPGTLSFTPDSELGWLRLDEDVTILAVPQTGFEFVEWDGALVGQPNPATLRLTEPASAVVRFEVTMNAGADPQTLTFEAAVDQDIVFQVENANEPVTWSLVQGALPPGMFFTASEAAITGWANDFGSYPVVIRVVDAIGLVVDVDVTLTVERPSVGLLQMAAPFLANGSPSAPLRSFLDFQGNRNGNYDLADFRSYVLENPDAPRAAAALDTPDPIYVPIRLRKEGGR